MKISVVIPTYNDLATLPQTVETVLAQKNVVFEVIVVNDAGSSPAGILPKDSRLDLVELSENGGPGRARNCGFAEARGDIVFFLDADDVIAPGLLAFAAMVFANPARAVAVVQKQTQTETTPGQKMIPPPPVPSADSANIAHRRLGTKAFCREFRRAHGPFLPSVTFFRKTALKAALGPAPWNEAFRNGEDTLLFLSLSEQVEIDVFDVLGTTYRVRSDSLTHADPFQSWIGRVHAMDALMARPDSEFSSTIVHYTAWRIRQNAVRRVARLHALEGRKTEGMKLMRQYLWSPFDLKMAAALMAMQLRSGR